LCQRCHNEHAKDSVKAVDGYNHIVNHMKKYHQIDVKTGLLPEAALPPPSWGSPFDAAKVAGSNRLVSHTPWQEEQLQAALINWVILKDISFVVAASPELWGLLTWNCSNLLKALPKSSTTIAEYTRSTLKRRKEEIKTLVTTAASKISISVDVWTSSNHLSFLGVVAHFAGKSLSIALYWQQLTTADAQYKQRDILLAFRNLYGDHTGAAQAAVILRVLKSFEIAPQLHCFVGDNALIQGLNVHNEINLTSSNRIRCAGHIINLVVKATLYGKGMSRFEAQLAAAPLVEQYEIFRSHGVVGKLHNFVNAVCASHKRRELFLLLQKEPRNDDGLYTYNTLQLRQDGGVRWHSVYYMLLRCLELCNPITRFMTRLQQQPLQRLDDKYNPLTNKLSSKEWEGVQQLVDFLQAPVEMTKRLEGNNSASGFGSLWQTLTNLQALWKLYSSTKAGFDDLDNSNSDYFIAAVKHGLKKLARTSKSILLSPRSVTMLLQLPRVVNGLRLG
jgi:hypothetical protein